MSVTSQTQAELIFDTEASRIAFGIVLDGVLCYVKSSGIHYVYDTAIANWKVVITTSSLCVQTTTKTLTNNLVEQSLLGTLTRTNIIPVGFLSVGRNLDSEMMGFHSKGAGNITMNVKMNGVVVLTTGVINSGAANNAQWYFKSSLTVQSVGVSGTIMGQGFWVNRNTGAMFEMKNLIPTIINTNIAQTYDITWVYLSSNAGNSISSTNTKINL